MKYFLTDKYFDGNTYLPAVRKDAADGFSNFVQSTSQANLDWYIITYEPEYLEQLLGCQLYNSFIEGIEAETPLDRWIKLRDKIFQNIQYNDNEFFYSPAAEYVFCMFLNRTNTQTSEKGQVKATVYGTINSDPTSIFPLVWNHMSDSSLKIQNWICNSGLFDDVLLGDKEELNRRSKRYPVVITGFKSAFKIWSRFCFRRFHHVNDLNI